MRTTPKSINNIMNDPVGRQQLTRFMLSKDSEATIKIDGNSYTLKRNNKQIYTKESFWVKLFKGWFKNG